MGESDAAEDISGDAEVLGELAESVSGDDEDGVSALQAAGPVSNVCGLYGADAWEGLMFWAWMFLFNTVFAFGMAAWMLVDRLRHPLGNGVTAWTCIGLTALVGAYCLLRSSQCYREAHE